MSTTVWIEKYRPQKLSEVLGNETVLRRLRQIAEDGSMPHLLLAGPPGVGKTTSVHALANELLGPDLVQSAVLSMNASDERGIAVVREKVKTFARRAIALPPGKHKIVILDEVESMTDAAQQALRRIMEVYSDTTRFALACNNSTRIIEAIQSRCAIIRLGRLSEEDILERLLHVCRAENLAYTDGGLRQLVLTADGDMRNALNNLQSTANGFELVDEKNVLLVCNVPPPAHAAALVRLVTKGDWRKAHDAAEVLLEAGFTPSEIAVVIKNYLFRTTELNEALALEFLRKTQQGLFQMSQGVASPLQLDALLATLCSVAADFAATAAQ